MVYRNTPLIIFIFFCLSVPMEANPINPYDLPLISEVQWTDSCTWSIELATDRWAITDSGTVRLYIASSEKFYTARFASEYGSLAVITPDSISVPEGEKVLIRNNDTIFIPDKNADDVFPSVDEWMQFPTDGWMCIINSPESGNSLVGIGGGEFIESRRNSIGNAGDYTTITHLAILDRDSLPYRGINMFTAAGWDIMYDGYEIRECSDENGLTDIAESIGQTTLYYLSDNNTLDGNILSPMNPAWSPTYVDTATEIADTIIYAPNFHVISLQDDKGAPVSSRYFTDIGDSIGVGKFFLRLFPNATPTREIRFYAVADFADSIPAPVATCICTYEDTHDTLYHTVEIIENAQSTAHYGDNAVSEQFHVLPDASGSISFIVTNRNAVENATIHLCSLDGRIVAVKNVHLREKGTHTIRWNGKSGKHMTPGKYICRLLYEGKEVAVRTVTLL